MSTRIQPCINGGMGDLFITRVLFDHNEIEEPVYLCEGEIMYYRGQSFHSVLFAHDLATILFKEAHLVNPDQYQKRNYQETHWFKEDRPINLFKYFNLKKHQTNDIVIHTKVRADNDWQQFESDRGLLNSYFANKKFNCSKIILIGERKVSVNLEASAHEQTTIYKELLELKNNNEVLDLTRDEIYNVPDYMKWRRDVDVIHSSKHVIGFGWGGNYALTWAFSENYTQWVGTQQHRFLDEMISRNDETKKNIRNFNDFLNELDKL